MSNNIASLLDHFAKTQPRNLAVLAPTGRDKQSGDPAYSSLNFLELKQRSDRIAWGFHTYGVRPGMKALLMIKPSLDFYAILFAVFKVGAIPVLIDPGMGWGDFLKCVKQVAPEVFIGIPLAHVLRVFRPSFFRSVKFNVTLGKRYGWGGYAIDELPGQKDEDFQLADANLDDLAAILFTSGSTGPAKGVSYTHRIFWTQIKLVQREYQIQPGEMDLACFPLFSLFSLASGATVVIPDMDPTRPAFVNPLRIIEPIRKFPITYSFGSPTLWASVSKYCVEHQIRLPGLRRIIMAGAPVPAAVHDRLLNHVLDPGAQTYTPYGATESLPIANFSGSEMLSQTAAATANGAGMCVGSPIQEITARIIKITDAAITHWDDSLVLPQGEIGELCVKGTCVTREYYNRPEATRLAKILDTDGVSVWHRVGDVGYFDQTDRFWFCGRKAHRVETASGTLFTIPCEAIFNQVPGVRRTALVGVGPLGQQLPALAVEADGTVPEAKLLDDLKLAASTAKLTQDIKNFFFCPMFPVDVRHNAKINREKLAVQATKLFGK